MVDSQRLYACIVLWSIVFAVLYAQKVVFQSDIVIPTISNNDLRHRLVLFDQDEPVDVLEKLRQQHKLNRNWRNSILNQICQQTNVRCKRETPVVFSTRIVDGTKKPLGILSIMEGDEPVDALAQFSLRHPLSLSDRGTILSALCMRPELHCTRHRALLFQQSIRGESNSVIGTLDIFDDTEPIDQIYRFVVDYKLPTTALQQLSTAICSRVHCERTQPYVYSRQILNTENQIIGRLEIPHDQEPVDVIQAFAQYYGLGKSFRVNLVNTVCNDPYVHCERKAPYVFASPIVLENNTHVGVLKVMEDEELADAVYQFAKEANLTMEVKYRLLETLCGQPGILCTRGQALLRTVPVSDAQGNLLGTIFVYEHQEPADAVYSFAEQHGLSVNEASNLVDILCGLTPSPNPAKKQEEPLECTRYAPVVFAIPIGAQNGSRLGVLEVLHGDEPADAIARFGNKHGMGTEEKANILAPVCERSGLPCTRTQGLMYQAEYTLPGTTHIERINFMDGEEPADVIYNYGLMRNLTFAQRKEFLISVCNEPRHRPNCTRAEPMLISIPVWETSDKKMGDLEILEGQEPIDMVYAFLEKHDLFQTAPLNTSLLEVVCNSTRVNCTRNRPRRILFSMQATYAGIQHTLQYVQPESDWICEDYYGGQRCEHYVEVLSKEFCQKHMTDWKGCEVRILEALRVQLEYYEERMWRGKDLYAKLGLVKLATKDEIDVAYNRLVKRFNNETEPQKYEKLQKAYHTLSDPEEKYYYDLPCMKFFGLCGKRQKDGGISISAD